MQEQATKSSILKVQQVAEILMKMFTTLEHH